MKAHPALFPTNFVDPVVMWTVYGFSAKDLLESQMKEIEMERLRILEENAALGEEMQKLIQEKDLLQSKTVETVRTTLRIEVL